MSELDEEVSAVREDLRKVRQELNDVYKDNEDLRQRNYEQKLSLDQQLFMVHTLTSECALLQADYTELEHRESRHEEAVSSLGRKLEELETEDQGRGDEIIGQEAADEAKLREEMSALAVENTRLVEEMEFLKEHWSSCTVDMKILRGKNKNLEEMISENILEIAGLKESLRCVKDECASLEDALRLSLDDKRHVMELLEETKEQLLQVTTDLHAARAPVMADRGNSIFAELEDDRVSVLNKYKDLKAECGEMAKRCARRSKVISKLMSEKIGMLRLVGEMKRGEEKATTEVIQALEKRLADLDAANKALTAELQVPIKILTDVDPGALKYVESIAAEAKQEVWRLRREFDDRSVALLMNQRLLNARQSELRLYQIENLKLKSELSDATFKLQSYQENHHQPLSAGDNTDASASQPAAPCYALCEDVVPNNLSGLSEEDSNNTDRGGMSKLASEKQEGGPGQSSTIKKDSHGLLDKVAKHLTFDGKDHVAPEDE